MYQRPLNGMLGQQQQQQLQATPAKGRIGRAVVPRESPYEARLRGEGSEGQRAEQDTPPPSKRRKRSESPPAGKSGHARALFGTQLTLSARPMSTPFVRTQQQQYQPLHDRTNMRVPSVGQRQDRSTDGNRPRVELGEPKISKQSKIKNSRKRVLASPSPPPPEATSDGDDGSDGQSSDGSVRIVSKVPERKQGPGPRKARQETRRSSPSSETTGARKCKQPMSPTNKPSRPSTERPLKRRGASPPRRNRTSIESDEQASEGDEDTPHPVASGRRKARVLVESQATVLDRDDHKTSKTSKKKQKRLADEHARPGGDPQSNTEQAASKTSVDRKHDAEQTAGPRTELRIRSRKKRGLLMLSEKIPAAVAAAAAPPPAAGEAAKAQTMEEAAIEAVEAEAEAEPADDAASNQSFEDWLQRGDAEEAQPCSPAPHDRAGNHRRDEVCIETDRSDDGQRLSTSASNSKTRPGPSSHPHPHHKHGDAQNGWQTRRSDIPGNAGKGSDGRSSVPTAGPASESQEESDREEQREKVLEPEDSDCVSSTSNVQHTRDAAPRTQTSAKLGLHATNIQNPVIPSDQPTRRPDSSDASDRESTPAQDNHQEKKRNGKDLDMGLDKGLASCSASTATPASHSSSSSSSAANGKAQGPRIARLGRRSVKSKEVFGLQVPDDRYMVPVELATADTPIVTSRPVEQDEELVIRRVTQSKQPMHADGLGNQAPGEPTANIQGRAQQGQQLSRDHAASEPARWMTNPATRGRKAASKADAAGQIPQSVVPYETVTSLVPARPRPQQQQQQQQRSDPKTATNSKTSIAEPSAKTTSNLPGFSKANGGAWSKHAEDLLGMTRPKGRGVPANV